MQNFHFKQPLDLQKTLSCGQCFHWRQTDERTFCGVEGGNLYRAVQQDDGSVIFYWETGTRQTIVKAFDLDRDYEALCQKFAKNKLLALAVKQGVGLRLMNISPWEALCTFILSQNNNIGRITGLVNTLCSLYGTHIKDGFYTFPSPQALACLTAEDLAPVKAGFRAKYLIDAAKKIAEGAMDLDALDRHSDRYIRKKLMSIYGVGPKVADCVLLFGFGRIRVVPMDVWMKRVVQNGFGGKLPRCCANAEGIAQQFLFDFARSNPNYFKNEQ